MLQHSGLYFRNVEVDQVCLFLCELALKQCNVSFCCCNHMKEVLPQKCGVVKRKYGHAYLLEIQIQDTRKRFIMNVEKDLQMSVTSLISHLIRYTEMDVNLFCVN